MLVMWYKKRKKENKVLNKCIKIEVQPYYCCIRFGFGFTVPTSHT